MDANPQGVMMTKMLGLFREASGGRDLPYSRLGFVNPLAMFDHMKDLFRIQRPTPYGDFLLLDIKRVDAKDDDDVSEVSAADGSQDTAVILGDFGGGDGSNQTGIQQHPPGVIGAVASENTTNSATGDDFLIIKPPVNGVGAVSSSSTVSHSIGGQNAMDASNRRPSSGATISASSSSGGSLSEKAAALQAKTFMLKDILVQVLNKLGPDGAPVTGIPNIFKTMTGLDLIPEEFGYINVTAMMDSFTDICQVSWCFVVLNYCCCSIYCILQYCEFTVD